MLRRFMTAGLSALAITLAVAPGARALAPQTLRSTVPDYAQVSVRFVNDSDRELSLAVYGGRGGEVEQRLILRPSKAIQIWGQSNSGFDLAMYLRYCRDSLEYTSSCDEDAQRLKWKNPAINWPWMSVEDWNGNTAYTVTHRFAADETHVWHMLSQSRIIIEGTRHTDSDSGTKRFTVHVKDKAHA